ncbi:MAG TPA: M28 family peptidase [Xanthobacteraceae bacterium]|nr:M28 family peptidase [Xanthobacteraceae bacterium]
MSLFFAILIALVVSAIGGAVYYMAGVPGRSYGGPLPPLTDEERALAPRLKGHVVAIASHEHNVAHYDELEKAARYIESALASYGYRVNRQTFDAYDYVSGKKPVRNIEVVVEARDAGPATETIVVGAHYDSAPGAPGANDNGSGAATVIELARLLADLKGNASRRVRLVLFVNEEPPYFRTAEMGSWQYAHALAQRNERVVAMYSLETIGYFSDAPGSQRYPALFGLIFPDRGNFLAFVGTLAARPLVRASIASFRAHTRFPTIGGVAPASIPGIDWSDHWAFEQHGFPAIMLTDTAPFRYPCYHTALDTPDRIEYERLARVVKGIERMVRHMARGS